MTRLHHTLASVAFLGLFGSVASAQCGGRWILEGQGDLGGTTGVCAVRVWDADGSGPGPAELYYANTVTDVWSWDGARRRTLARSSAGSRQPVWAILPHAGKLVVGGEFTRIGGVAASGIAQFDGLSWSAVGLGQLTVIEVAALAEYQGQLYAAGTLRVGGSGAYTNIARWDGQAWTTLGAGVNNAVFSLCVHDGLLYVGGSFSQAGGQARQSIAAWDGAAWSSVPGVSFSSGANVGALLSTPEGLVIGGGLGRLNGTTVRGVVRWNAGACAQIGDGVDFLVTTLTSWRGELHAGGSRNTSAMHRIARWDGAAWRPLAGGFGDLHPNGPYCMESFHDRLYVGGDLFVSDLGLVAGSAVWDGERWGRFGSGFDSNVRTVLSTTDGLLAGGDFLRYDDVACRGVARWEGDRWVQLGNLQGGVMTLGVFNGHAVASGSIPGHVAEWNGEAWAPLGTGLSDTALAMAEFEGSLVVGGTFSAAGGSPAPFVARWDGAGWSRMGTRQMSAVGSMAVANGVLYLGIVSGGGPFLFGWNGADWDAIEPRPSGPVLAMKAQGQELVIAGTLTVPGQPTTNCYAWNGAAWRALPPGTYGTVALDEYQGALIAGGPFNQAGGASATGVARLEGEGWGPFAPEFSGSAVDLTTHGPELVAVGSFDRLGGTARTARWTPDGVPWFALGPGDQAVVTGSTVVLRAHPASGYVDAETEIRWQQRLDSGAWVDVADGPFLRDGVVLGEARGASTPTLTIATQRPFGPIEIRCSVTNSCGNAFSGSAHITADPPPCPADFNADGFLDFFDYLDFVSCFEGSGCSSPDPLAADFNGDGFVDFFDYGDFVEAFAAGC